MTQHLWAAAPSCLVRLVYPVRRYPSVVVARNVAVAEYCCCDSWAYQNGATLGPRVDAFLAPVAELVVESPPTLVVLPTFVLVPGEYQTERVPNVWRKRVVDHAKESRNPHLALIFAGYRVLLVAKSWEVAGGPLVVDDLVVQIVLARVADESDLGFDLPRMNFRILWMAAV